MRVVTIEQIHAAMIEPLSEATVAFVAVRMTARQSPQMMVETAIMLSAPARIEPQLTWSRDRGCAYVARVRSSETISSAMTRSRVGPLWASGGVLPVPNQRRAGRAGALRARSVA